PKSSPLTIANSFRTGDSIGPKSLLPPKSPVVLPRCCPDSSQCQERKNRAEILNQNQTVGGAPEEIRTPDPQIRSLVLYPAELRARLAHRAGKRSQNGQSRRERASSYRLRPAMARFGVPASLMPARARRAACRDRPRDPG